METVFLLSILASFVLAIFLFPRWIKKCRRIGFLWEDMNKFRHPKRVASSGGIVTVMAFIIGVLIYIAGITFTIGPESRISLEIFALLTTILILAIIGFVDDLFGWRHGGLSIRFRLFLSFVASIPLIVINAGTHVVEMPFIGVVDIGLIYPLFLIPIGVIGATTTYNFLAGFNGLEAGQGIIIISFLSFVAYATGKPWLAAVGLCIVASLIAFYIFNRHPAKIFPGDSLTYPIGGIIATMAILGNFERIAVFVFIPYIAETFLKLRGRLRKQSFALPQRDGSLKMPYKKIYGLTHLSLFILKRFKKKVYEKDIVYFIFAIQLLLVMLALIIFREVLFK